MFRKLGVVVVAVISLASAVGRGDYCDDQRAAVAALFTSCEEANLSYPTCEQYIFSRENFRMVSVGNPSTGVMEYRCIAYDCSAHADFIWAGAGVSSECGSSPGGGGSGPDGPDGPSGPGAPPPNIQTPTPACGSFIKVENQIVGEFIPVTAAPFTLVYFSNWVPGRIADYRYKTIISNSTVRSETTGFETWVYDESNTQVDNDTFNDDPDQTYTYIWDGLDSSNNETWGKVKYRLKFKETATDFNTELNHDIYFGSLKAKKLGLGGWVPSIWKFYDHVSKTLFDGDGGVRSVEAEDLGSGVFRIAEIDGSTVHYFDSVGRITHTKTGRTGTTIYTFNYDGSGRLSSIAEPFSRTTTFNRNMSGVLTSITAPNTQSTTVSINGNGYLASVTSPASEVFAMTYVDANGLLSTFTKPNSVVTTFTYDALGMLVSDTHSGGPSLTFGGTYHNQTLTTEEGRQSTSVWSILAGTTTQTYTRADGSARTVTSSLPASLTITDMGKQSIESYTTDARFDQQVRRPSTIQKYDFGIRSTTFGQSVTLSTPTDPFSITTLTETETTGASVVTSTYTGSTKTLVRSTTEGRTQTTEFDTYERPISFQIGGQTPIDFTYTDELLTAIDQGSRNTVLAYHSTSRLLTSITNELSQTTSFGYDSAQRLSSMTLPDSRVIQYMYDFAGNLVQITPPNRPTHYFTLNSKETVSAYIPPALDLVNNYNTTYTYNDDKQLTQILTCTQFLIQLYCD